MEYKQPNNKQTIEPPKDYEEPEELIQQPQEERERQSSDLQIFSLPTLRFDVEVAKNVAISLIASGENSDEARKSFDVLVKLLNEKIDLNNKEKKGKVKNPLVG